MKNIFTLLAIVFMASLGMAQEVKKNTYFLDGDVIVATLYHDNGAVAQTGYYTPDNKLTGEWVSYDVNGNKTAVAEYNNGKKVNTWYFFNNKNIQEVNYVNARIAKVNTWKVADTYVVSNNP